MTKVTREPLRVPRGPMTWEAFAQWYSEITRDSLRRMDIRDANNSYAGGILADEDAGTVTLGDAALPDGRTVGVPTLTDLISDAGRARDYRFGHPVNLANRNSVQNSDTIITATSGSSTSTIAIGSHSVKFGGESGAVDVAYNSGSVTGLTPETTYYVYADDAAYAGGAVTYLATTNPDNLIRIGRYYVGYVVTPITATAGNISAATSANPIEFTTSSNHGWTSADTVEFASLPGDFGTNLNATQRVITVTALNKFTIAVDGSAYAAYTTGGTATRVTTANQSGGGAGAGVGGSRFDYAIP